jgi:hypothetical protein
MRQPPRKIFATGSTPKTGSGTSTLAAAPYSSSGHPLTGSGTLITGHSTLTVGSGTLSAQRKQQIEGTQPPDQATAERDGTTT